MGSCAVYTVMNTWKSWREASTKNSKKGKREMSDLLITPVQLHQEDMELWARILTRLPEAWFKGKSAKRRGSDAYKILERIKRVERIKDNSR